MATNDELKENNDLLRQQNDLLKQRSGIQEDTLDEARDFANIIADQTKQIQFQVSEKRQLRSISTSINKISQEAFSVLRDELGTTKNLKDISKSRLTLKQNLIGLNSLNGKIIVEDKEAQEEINNSIKGQILSTNKLLKELKDIEDTSDKISKNFGVKTFGAISDITKKIPGLNRFSGPFEDAAEAARKHATRMEGISRLDGMSKFNKGMASAKAGMKTLGPALKKALGPLFLINELISAFGTVNKESVELQKSMMLTSGEAMDFRSELSTAAKTSGDINVTTSKLLKSFSSLNEQFGFITNFASKTLVTMTQLTDVVGVSAQSAGNLAAASSLTGQSFESNYKDVLGTSYELQRQEGVQFSLKDILEETGKVTGTVRANLGANPARIAEAITQAKLFGATLDQVASSGKALLNFESSITSELEAELLLGRDINLEKARLAALNGDQVTLAKELRREAGDFTEFTSMNVIQQEALAKSLGMQSDALADILFKQDVQGKTARELRALGKDELADRLEAQTVQDKFNNSVAKLKELFADVATVLMPLFEMLGGIFNFIGKIVKFIEPVIGTISGAIAGFMVGGPVGALVGGTIGAISDIDRATTTADDAIIPAGYGDTIIKKGKDTIALNNNDTVVAGTNLGGGSDNSEIKKTNMLLEQILSKQGTIKLDSTDMGTAMSVNSYAIQ